MKQAADVTPTISKESSKELLKKIVITIVAIAGFTTFVPKGAAGIAETFGLELGLAFRIFAGLYFSLPMLLIVFWNIDFVMKQRSIELVHEKGEEDQYYLDWFKTRLPLLILISVIYFCFVVALPIIADELVTTASLVAVGVVIYYLYIKFISYKKADLLFHAHFLIMLFTLLASIGLYAIPWSKDMHYLVIGSVITGIFWVGINVLWFSKIPSEHQQPGGNGKRLIGGRNSLLCGILSLTLIAGILWWPLESLRPAAFLQSDRVVFNAKNSQDFHNLLQSTLVDKNATGTKEVLRFFQWRGIALLLIPMVCLILYRYQCRRYGTRELLDGKQYIKQEEMALRVNAVDAWLVTLTAMLIMLFEPAKDPANDKFNPDKANYSAVMNAPQWYLLKAAMQLFMNVDNNQDKSDIEQLVLVNTNLKRIIIELDSINLGLDSINQRISTATEQSKQQHEEENRILTLIGYATAGNQGGDPVNLDTGKDRFDAANKQHFNSKK
ncbi:MAG: hypothetical protein IPM61_04420 [Chlorobi bacterium]|nr:hypothetical protein [Chlorobiota bacterium]MBX7217427.1 hypothetical protein [Candidatus Kapabacteria bacterium]